MPGAVTVKANVPSFFDVVEVVVVHAPLPVLLCSFTGRAFAGGSEPVRTTFSVTIGSAGVATRVPPTGAAVAATGTSCSPVASTVAATRDRTHLTDGRAPTQTTSTGRRRSPAARTLGGAAARRNRANGPHRPPARWSKGSLS